MRIVVPALLASGAVLALAGCAAEPRDSGQRDLTLLETPARDPAVASARELLVAEPDARTSRSAARLAPEPRPARRRALPAHPSPRALAPAPGPAATPAAGPPRPAERAPEAAKPAEVAHAGAARALEPGDSASAIPATSGSAASLPGTDLGPLDRVLRHGGVIIIGDDRCIPPGRGRRFPPGLRARGW